MKLIIQIPCYNEEETLGNTLKELPKKIEGISTIEYLIIDDGSTDNTLKIAENYGVDHIIKLDKNYGLGIAFQRGLEASLERNADIIVNTDGDNQYNAKYIEKLIKPIIENQCDLVIGRRDINNSEEMSKLKKIFQKIGSWLVKKITSFDILDATSGFRAYSKESAKLIYINTRFSYTVESLLQLIDSNIRINYISIETNKKTRESRLFKNIFHFMLMQGIIIVNGFVTYRPLLFFNSLAILFIIPGFFLFFRYLYLYISDNSSGHIQSLILGNVCIITGVFFFSLGIILNSLKQNRMLIKKIMRKIK